MEEYVVLKGGRSTKNVVRKGNIVYRPHKDTSVFVNSVLRFFEQKQIPYTQRFVGTDENGRDMFTFIDGFVPNEIGETTSEQLCALMKIVKCLHDCSQEFTKNGRVICHNDLSPCNTVFVNDKPIAVIDWDSAAVGERWEDLTYIIWLWGNIGSHKRQEIDILGQMKTALSVYGADKLTLAGFADKLIWRMDKVLAEMSPDNYQFERTKEWVAFSKSWVTENRGMIAEEIG